MSATSVFNLEFINVQEEKKSLCLFFSMWALRALSRKNRISGQRLFLYFISPFFTHVLVSCKEMHVKLWRGL